ncbi:folylpolyglutamate synthase-like isoform X4 [Triticum urartu]|uniref:folylpolyglutamate synthase-like isoform X4 n=1 Tax=Triticum urartu TaxID=4572 RepID=UPI002043CE11|nr:folylpolyglutamate synthase-like isoform X4 [Triticum urartu]
MEHAGGAAAGEYEEVLDRLSSLITQKVRADTGNRGNQWDLMGRYLQILELEEPIARMKVIHAAGTKGHPCHATRSGSSDSSAHQSGQRVHLRQLSL